MRVQLFEDLAVVRAIYDHFLAGRAWEETEFYQTSAANIERGYIVRGCRTRAEFDRRWLEVDKLYADIQANGFRSQAQIAREEKNPYSGEDEITINIGRHGDLFFADGRHRLAIAKITGVKTVPVKVTIRHEQWYQFLQEICRRIRRKELFEPLSHPDLVDMLAKYDELNT